MSISYTVGERINPRDLSAPKKFYAFPKTNGEMTLRELSKRIADISTVSSIDTMAVLEALLQVIPEELAEGNIVRLGDFGSFFTTISSGSAEKEEDFYNDLIEKTSIKFRPGKQVKNVLNNVTYKKVNA